jgi:ABC-type polysaccharide/polyol phosphate transport system ATPase subunit
VTTAKSSDGRAILAKDLSKRYRIYDKPIHRLYDVVLPFRTRYRDFWAVRNVYLDVAKGSTIGIIGANGAGKSTLLKLLSGITEPTTGELKVEGRVTSLIELGAGFHPEFSGRDNAFLACSILGMSDEEIEAKLKPIIAFSELGDFIDRPVKTYSSGMYVRLGFSVATCVDPDVLLIDEALSVGDEHFKGKCLRRLNEFSEGGGTTLFVSHDLGSVRTMCSHVVLMDGGEIVEQGPPEDVADEYLKRIRARAEDPMQMRRRGNQDYPVWGSGEIEVEDVLLLGAGGKPGRLFQTGEDLTVRIVYRALADAHSPVFGIGIYRSDGTYVNGSNHLWREQPIEFGAVQSGETGEVDMNLGGVPLLAGQYYLSTFVYDHSKPAPTAIDHREHVTTFEIVDARAYQHGLLTLPSIWRVRRRPGGAPPREEESRR